MGIIFEKFKRWELLNRRIKIVLSELVIHPWFRKLQNMLTGRRHIILTFHRIRPDGSPTDPFDTCPSIPAGVFQKTILHIKKNYEIVSLRFLCENRGLKHPLAAITFDDGWRDNYEVAFPILKTLRIPATVFISSGKIGAREPFWQQKLGRLFYFEIHRRGKEGQAKLKNFLKIEGNPKLNKGFYRRIVNEWKCLNQEEINSRLASYEWTDETLSHSPIFLDDKEIREMLYHHIEFGSHTVNHVILPRSSEKVIISELVESKRRLEEITGQTIDMLSYPNGNVSDKVVQIAREIGYKIGCTTKRSPVGADADPLLLPRIEITWDL